MRGAHIKYHGGGRGIVGLTECATPVTQVLFVMYSHEFPELSFFPNFRSALLER
jgi:hypothetical protein